MTRTTSAASYQTTKTEHEESDIDKIYEFLHTRGESTRAQIANALGMEKSSVSARVNKMLHDGLLLEGNRIKCQLTGRLAYIVMIRKKLYNVLPSGQLTFA
jgi:Mn-dependent DtxR family transcriptional regulator